MGIPKSETPKLSVIIPTLNEGKSIENLLRSLETQSFRDFEVVIIDGGSTDGTIQKAEKFGATVLVKKGLKEYPSRNLGAKIARGKILLFTGADVIMLDKALERVIHEFEIGNLDGLCAFGGMYDAPLWGKLEYYLHYSLLNLWIKISSDFHGSTNFMAFRKEEFISSGGFKDRIDSDGNLLNTLGHSKNLRFFRGTKCFFASGRRMRKMGFVEFNFHFAYMLDIFLPFLRDSSLILLLKKASLDYRDNHNKNLLSKSAS